MHQEPTKRGEERPRPFSRIAITDCVQAHLRTEDVEDADIVLPTPDLPRQLVDL
jgi:hypothetical protein